MKLTLATSWSELSAWQKKELSYAVLSLDFSSEKTSVLALLRIFVMRKNTLWERFLWHRLMHQVPVSVLLPFLEKLLQQADLHSFPDISSQLKRPGDRMNTCTIRQFSFCDAIYYKLQGNKEQSAGYKDILQRQLVASLYTFKDGKFDPLQLPKVAEITDKIDEKTRSRIVFAYMCVRNYIENRYPKIFPKSSPSPSEGGENVSSPSGRVRVGKYIPFTKVIHSMAMDERQPLGNLHQCNDTLIYDFFDILQEALLRSE